MADMAANRYSQILEHLFFAHYRKGDSEVIFDRDELPIAAEKLGVKLPKNLGDLIYSFRFRTPLPKRILATAPAGKSWIIRQAGRSRYSFNLGEEWNIRPNPALLRVKVPDSTPGFIARYALDDEQALLARVRYNRLIDIFTGVACYSLQNHLRTAVKGLGQVETDEVYVGVDRYGAHYVFPVQAKGGRDQMSVVQIEQDVAMCGRKFCELVCRPVGAQFLANNIIVLMEFAATTDGIRVVNERHYQLVAPESLTTEDLETYQRASRSATAG